MDNYRKLQESFVSNHNGTTVLEISVVLSTPVLSIFLRSSLSLLVYQNISAKGLNNWLTFLLDFVCLVIPTLLSATGTSDHVDYQFIFIITIAIGVIIWTLFTVPKSSSKRGFIKLKDFLDFEVTERFQFLSNFKAYTLIGTVISILAVDFTVFPRRFCKTEIFGTGFMDAGVGFFIVSNAVTSPEARNKLSVRKNSIHHIYKSVISSSPLLVLGIARIITTKGVNYQEHVTEYGTHWNFFFTLAVVKILSSILSFILPVRLWKFVMIALCAVYQYLLAYRGLSNYIIQGIDGKGGRNGLIDSNREGIISSLGCFILYLFGVEIGRLIFKQERNTVKEYLILLCMLTISAILSFTVLPLISIIEPVSRRFANLPYVIWLVGICLQLLSSYLTVDLIVKFIQFLQINKHVKDKKENKQAMSFTLLDAVNYNGLLYFLLANLLTGVVNLNIKTILVPPFYSVIIVIVYMLVLSIISIGLYCYKIKLKFW